VHILLLPHQPAGQKLLRLRAKKSPPPRGNLTMDSLFLTDQVEGRWKRLTGVILRIRGAWSKPAAMRRRLKTPPKANDQGRPTSVTNLAVDLLLSGGFDRNMRRAITPPQTRF
jgi:hypothetical protein